MAQQAIATEVACAGGVILMDGHRPIENDVYAGGELLPTRQLRATDNKGNMVEVALTRVDIANLIAVLGIYE